MKHFALLLLGLFFMFQVIAQDKNEASKLLAQAEEAYNNGNYRQSVQLYSQCLGISPASKEGYLGRAAAKEQLKDFGGALTDYSLFLEFEPAHIDALLGRANVKFKLGKFDEAKKDYTSLLQLPSGETNYVMFQRNASSAGSTQITTAQSDLKPLIYNYIGLTEYHLKNFTLAKKWLDTAIYLRPAEADYYVNRGIVLEKINEQQAIEDYHTALKLNPGHAQALSNLGVINGKRGDGSERYFDQAIESDSSMLSPYLERGYQRMKSGYFKGALEDYNKALEIEKSDPEIWLNRGFVKEKLGDLKGAYSDYTTAINLDEQYEKAWLNRGNVLSKQGKLKEAIEDYTVAITYDPGYGAAYYNRAAAKEKLKQRESACSDLAQAEKLGIKIDSKLKSNVCL